MSIRRIRRAEMLNGYSSTQSLTTRTTQLAIHRSVSSPVLSEYRKTFAPTFQVPTVHSLTRSLSGMTLVDSQGVLSDDVKSGLKVTSSPLADLPTELQLCIADHLVHADLLVLRRVSRSFTRLADSRLAKTTAVRIAVAREIASADSTVLIQTETNNLAEMRFNHAYLRSVSHLDIEELRWSRNPAPEIRMICQCLVALHRGHLSPNYLDTAASQKESWASIRAALGTPEFRRWIASLRKSATRIADTSGMGEFYETLGEEDLLTSGRLWATNIWSTLGTGFARMLEVSAVGHRVLLFVSAAIHYITLRSGLVRARIASQQSMAKLQNWASFSKCLRA